MRDLLRHALIGLLAIAALVFSPLSWFGSGPAAVLETRSAEASVLSDDGRGPIFLAPEATPMIVEAPAGTPGPASFFTGFAVTLVSLFLALLALAVVFLCGLLGPAIPCGFTPGHRDGTGEDRSKRP